MANRIEKFMQPTFREKMLLLEALLLHLWTGLLLKIIPFRRIPKVFSGRQSDTPAKEEDQSRHNVSGRQSDDIELIRIAIGRAGSVSPWRNRCLVSSLAGRCMLRRRKISSQVSLGVAKNPEGKTIAHAWLKSGEYEIVDRRGGYTELFSF